MQDKNTRQTLSVIIPALDEATTIGRTLARLVPQAAIDEVIVVDNGSRDGTPDIVREFAHPKVVLIHAPARGIASARNAGFDYARGEFLARTDADTLVADDWGETIMHYFSEHPEASALTGLCTWHDSPFDILSEIWQSIQIRFGMVGGQISNMYGPNMAIRRNAWLQIRGDTQTREDVAEDLDMALCLARYGLRIDQVTAMRAQTSSRRMRTTPPEILRFHLIGLRTLTDQGFDARPIHAVFIGRAVAVHTLLWPFFRFWDFDRREPSLRPGAARISAVGDIQHRKPLLRVGDLDRFSRAVRDGFDVGGALVDFLVVVMPKPRVFKRVTFR